MPTAPRRWFPGILATLCLASSIFAQNTNEPRQLEVAKPIEREMKGGDVHSYLVTLAAGQFMQAVVDQRGIDVVVSLYGPDGKQIAEVDSPNGTNGPEPVSVLAKKSGSYRLDVRSLEKNAPAGRYEVKVEALRGATVQDRIEDLAVALVGAKTEEERSALLEAEKDSVSPELWEALNKHAVALYQQGTFGLNLSVLRLELRIAEQIGDKHKIVRTLVNIGLNLGYQGELSQSLENFQKALVLGELIGNKKEVARALVYSAYAYREQGNNAQSLESLQKALAGEFLQKPIAELDTPGDKALRGVALSYVGYVHQDQGNYALALEYHQKALSHYEMTGRKRDIGVALGDIGADYLDQGNYAMALEYLQKGLTTRESTGDRTGTAPDLGNIATIYRLQGDFDRALEYYRKCLALGEESGDKLVIGETLDNIGYVYFMRGDYAQALKFAGDAAEMARRVGAHTLLLDARTKAGMAYRALNQPAQARRAFEEAIALVEVMRAQVAGGEQEKQRFFENKVSPYQEMVGLLVAQNDTGGALTCAERAKARVLSEVLRSGRVNVRKAMTAQEKEQELKLKNELVSLNTQMTRASQSPQPDQTRLAGLKSRLEKTRLDYEAFQTNLYAAHPQLKTQRGEAQTIRLEEVTAILPDAKSAALEFVVTKDKTYLFVLTKNSDRNKTPVDVKVYTLPVKQKDLADRSERFRQQIAKGDLDFQQPARELYDLLLKPAQSQLQDKTTLVIVPDDVLWNLPFQALQPTANYYVIENQALFYTPSLTVLREMLKGRGKQFGGPSTSTLLAFGNPAVNKQTAERVQRVLMDEKLEPLPEAEKQVTALRQLYGPAQSRVYVGADAREERAKKEAGDYRILQFATHGVLNDSSPMYSHIVLSQAEGDSNEDGLLEAWEMMNLDLHADMVVLSACETARGRVGAGEGIIGMSWALFVAGAPTTVVSQWKVESASTTQLMVEFHRNLKAGMQNPKSSMSKAKAMQQASIKLLKSSKYSHPFYWAAFVVVGDGF